MTNNDSDSPDPNMTDSDEGVMLAGKSGAITGKSLNFNSKKFVGGDTTAKMSLLQASADKVKTPPKKVHYICKKCKEIPEEGEKLEEVEGEGDETTSEKLPVFGKDQVYRELDTLMTEKFNKFHLEPDASKPIKATYIQDFQQLVEISLG